MLLEGLLMLGVCILVCVLRCKKVETVVKQLEITKADRTLEYWNRLSLKEQREYMEYNLDLKAYRNMLTDNRWYNAKHIAELSMILDKEFTNKEC